MEARTQAWLDQDDAHVTAMIRHFGWAITYVGDACCAPDCCGGGQDGTSFAYTIGMFGLHHPELLIFGVPPETAAGVLNRVGQRIRHGGDLVPGVLVSFPGWSHRIIPEAVPNPEQIVYAANRYYLRPDELSVPVLQLSYDDADGRFPWEDGYAAPQTQPRPGTFRANL